MDAETIKVTIQQLIDKYSSLGEVTDVRLNAKWVETLDPRGPMERILRPHKMGDVWISALSDLGLDEVHISFKTTFVWSGVE
jgi:hypothetical protein